jgi:hypothetical protein
MRDDKTANTDHTHIPLPSLAPSITSPASDRCDIAGVSVPPLRRSAPSISRFCPVLGWWTMLKLFARRAAESNSFSIRNVLWSSAEDDLLVQAVGKHSTSDVLFPDWSEVGWELPGRSEQQCKERYRLTLSVVELTFVFLSRPRVADQTSVLDHIRDLMQIRSGVQTFDPTTVNRKIIM